MSKARFSTIYRRISRGYSLTWWSQFLQEDILYMFPSNMRQSQVDARRKTSDRKAKMHNYRSSIKSRLPSSWKNLIKPPLICNQFRINLTIRTGSGLDGINKGGVRLISPPVIIRLLWGYPDCLTNAILKKGVPRIWCSCVCPLNLRNWVNAKKDCRSQSKDTQPPPTPKSTHQLAFLGTFRI